MLRVEFDGVEIPQHMSNTCQLENIQIIGLICYDNLLLGEQVGTLTCSCCASGALLAFSALMSSWERQWTNP